MSVSQYSIDRSQGKTQLMHFFGGEGVGGVMELLPSNFGHYFISFRINSNLYVLSIVLSFFKKIAIYQTILYFYKR